MRARRQSRRFSATLQDWGTPERLSLDEFSRRKGKGRFATVLTDLDKSSLLEVIDLHKSDDIIAILNQQPESVRASVKEVCVNMWEVWRSLLPKSDPCCQTFSKISS